MPICHTTNVHFKPCPISQMRDSRQNYVHYQLPAAITVTESPLIRVSIYQNYLTLYPTYRDEIRVTEDASHGCFCDAIYIIASVM